MRGREGRREEGRKKASERVNVRKVEKERGR